MTDTPTTARTEVLAELDRLGERRAEHEARIDALMARINRTLTADLIDAMAPALAHPAAPSA